MFVGFLQLVKIFYLNNKYLVGSKWLCLFGLFFLCEEGSIGLNFFKDIISFYVCNNFMNKKCGDLFFSLKVIVFDF